MPVYMRACARAHVSMYLSERSDLIRPRLAGEEGFYCKDGSRFACPENKVCPTVQMSEPRECNEVDIQAVPDQGNPPAGPTRCICPTDFYGHRDQDGQAPFRTVASLTDEETTTDLRCSKCPYGVFCNEKGSEFSTLILFRDYWQDMSFFEADPERLSASDVEHCAGKACPGTPWANLTCDDGFSGPLCGLWCICNVDV